MSDIICPILELSVVFPGTLLSYLPMRHHLRIKYWKLIATIVPFLLLLCILGGVVCYFLKIGTLWIILPILLLVCAIYCRTLKISY